MRIKPDYNLKSIYDIDLSELNDYIGTDFDRYC